MTIDKYTKFLLTLIAVGIIGINFHLFKGSVVKDALAATANDWQVVSDDKNRIIVFSNNGKQLCNISPLKKQFHIWSKWLDTGC